LGKVQLGQGEHSRKGKDRKLAFHRIKTMGFFYGHGVNEKQNNMLQPAQENKPKLKKRN